MIYTRSRILGKGGQGTIWLYIEHDANGQFKRFIAGKEIDVSYEVQTIEELDENLRREIQILQTMKVNKQSAISFIEMIIDEGLLHLFMDFANGGSLESLDRCLSEVEINLVMKKLLKGVIAMQRHRVVHRDLNHKNVLIHFS